MLRRTNKRYDLVYCLSLKKIIYIHYLFIRTDNLNCFSNLFSKTPFSNLFLLNNNKIIDVIWCKYLKIPQNKSYIELILIDSICQMLKRNKIYLKGGSSQPKNNLLKIMVLKKTVTYQHIKMCITF